MIWYFSKNSAAAKTIGGASVLGEFIYSGSLLLYTSIITTCPCLAILNTPYHWRKIRRRGLRFIITLAIVVMGGVIQFTDNAKTANETRQDLSYPRPEEYGCMARFLYNIVLPPIESLCLISAWYYCAHVLRATFTLHCQDFIVFLLLLITPKFIRKFIAGHIIKGQYPAGPLLLDTTKSDTDLEAQTLYESLCRNPVSPCIKMFLRYVWFISCIYSHLPPFFFLWKMRWLRRHVRSIIQPPTPANTLYPEYANLTETMTKQSENWSSDECSFG
jgi:hypothetical protein